MTNSSTIIFFHVYYQSQKMPPTTRSVSQKQSELTNLYKNGSPEEFKERLIEFHDHFCGTSVPDGLSEEVSPILQEIIASIAGTNRQDDVINYILCILGNFGATLGDNLLAGLFSFYRGPQLTGKCCCSLKAVIRSDMSPTDVMKTLDAFERTFSYTSLGYTDILFALHQTTNALESLIRQGHTTEYIRTVMNLIEVGLVLYENLTTRHSVNTTPFGEALVRQCFIFMHMKTPDNRLLHPCFMAAILDQISQSMVTNEKRSSSSTLVFDIFAMMFACIIMLCGTPKDTRHVLSHLLQGDVLPSYGKLIPLATDANGCENFFEMMAWIFARIGYTPEDDADGITRGWFKLSRLGQAPTLAQKKAVVASFCAAEPLKAEDLLPHLTKKEIIPSSDVCLVCVEALTDTIDSLSHCSCTVPVHYDCLIKWLIKSPKCMICKRSICAPQGEYIPVEFVHPT